MGIEGLNSLKMYGAVATFAVGQNNNANGPWPRNNLNDFNRWIDFTQPATRATSVATSSRIRPARKSARARASSRSANSPSVRVPWITPRPPVRAICSLGSRGFHASRPNAYQFAWSNCGVAPGCSNLILGRLAARHERVERFWCAVGGLPVESSGGGESTGDDTGDETGAGTGDATGETLTGAGESGTTEGGTTGGSDPSGTSAPTGGETPTGGATPTGGGAEGGLTDGAGSGGAADSGGQDEGGGCGCRQDGPGAPVSALLGLVLLAARRRR